MKPPYSCSAAAIVTFIAAASLSSCSLESSYHFKPAQTSVRSTVGYSSHGSTSTSWFISTSNSRWAYDPTCRSYYDYETRCYYDPWLNGYYPRGFRPPVVVGVPHPHGWTQGMKSCPPPNYVRSIRLRDYQHRHQAYRKLNHAWARSIGSNHPGRHLGQSRSAIYQSDQRSPTWHGTNKASNSQRQGSQNRFSSQSIHRRNSQPLTHQRTTRPTTSRAGTSTPTPRANPQINTPPGKQTTPNANRIRHTGREAAVKPSGNSDHKRLKNRSEMSR